MAVSIPEVDIAALLQAFYIGAAASILTVYFIPSLHAGFLDYGARDDHVSRTTKRESMLRALVDWIAGLKVPHNYFTHFYIVSVASSLFWLQQLVSNGSVLRWIANYTSARSRSMSLPQVYLCWLLLLLQGARRLYESLYLAKPSTGPKKSAPEESSSNSNPRVTSSPRSQSTMWIGHYAIGLCFYLATNIAVWIHGLPAILAAAEQPSSPSSDPTPRLVPFPSPLLLPGPLLLLLLFFLLSAFLAASTLQHSIHAHLASLPRYTLPTAHAAFTHLISPHYTCECGIYLALALLAAPSQHATSTSSSNSSSSNITAGAAGGVNPTVAAALLFVAVNLGVSAEGTRTWSLAKFTEQRAVVRRRWRMLPGVW